MRISFKRQTARKSRSKRGRKKFLGACLSATLATAWGGSSEAVTIHLSATPTETISHASVHFYVNSTSGFTDILGTLIGGQANDFYINYPRDNEQNFLGYTILGLYGETPNEGVTVGFPNDLPIQNHSTFETEFPVDTDPLTVHMTEDQVRTVVRNVSFYGYFLETFTSSLLTPIGSQTTLVNFSDAAPGGTAIAEFVPEPASWIMLVSAAGMITAFARGRREL